MANRALLTNIQHLHLERRQTYGSPLILGALRAQGQRVGEHRVARLMRQAGLQAKTVTKWRVPTDTAHRFPVAANHLNRQFTVTVPNQMWAGVKAKVGCP
ncbi:MAG: IS3 family transposase [Nitrospira sp.]|nr:IS3 family transposase [Nitrospira sp.]